MDSHVLPQMLIQLVGKRFVIAYIIAMSLTWRSERNFILTTVDIMILVKCVTCMWLVSGGSSCSQFSVSYMLYALHALHSILLCLGNVQRKVIVLVCVCVCVCLSVCVCLFVRLFTANLALQAMERLMSDTSGFRKLSRNNCVQEIRGENKRVKPIHTGNVYTTRWTYQLALR